MKSRIFLLTYIILFPILNYATEKDANKQHIDNNNTNMMQFFFRQPKYTRSSIKCFLKHIYNNNKYAQNFLSLNFSHIATFLSYSNETDLPRDYIAKIMTLFGQKLKSTTYINSYAFCDLLEVLPSLIKSHFNQEKEKNCKIESFKECLYSYLLTDFKKLKENPNTALEELSNKIYNIAFRDADQSQDISIIKLQHAVISFLEIALSKLIWSPIDQEEVWLSVKSIAHNIEQLHNNNIIPDVYFLDQLLWSLVYRFTYFLGLAGAELSQKCYQVIQEDLATQESALWSLPEQEAFITTKLAYLEEYLLEAEIRSRAYQEGIITNALPLA